VLFFAAKGREPGAHQLAISSSAVNPFANISASVQLSGRGEQIRGAATLGLRAVAAAVRVGHGVGSGGEGPPGSDYWLPTREQGARRPRHIKSFRCAFHCARGRADIL